ncbi:MAG: hypothetical protein Q9227_004555 [Pyrenula ochraceoflavens]
MKSLGATGGSSRDDEESARTAHARRREQVRRAQRYLSFAAATKYRTDPNRNHRERKEQYIKSLEIEVMRLREREATSETERRTLAAENAMLRDLLHQNGISAPPRQSPSTMATVNVVDQPGGVQRLRVTLPGSPNIGLGRLGYQASSSGESTDGSRGFSQLQTHYTQVPSVADEPLSSKSSSPSNERAPRPTPYLDRDLPAPPPHAGNHPFGLDSYQTGIDFILSLEEPCLPHTRGPGNVPTRSPTYHGLTTPAAILAQGPTGLLTTESHWQVPTVEVERLLELSANLDLIGELTPVQAWSRIRRWPGFERCTRERLEQLRDRLREEVQCLGLAGIHHIWPLIVIFLIEFLFWLCVYLPCKHYLQKSAVYPEKLSKNQRRDLFKRCANNIPDIENYLQKWFLNNSDIRRENVKEFLSWALLDTDSQTKSNRRVSNPTNGYAVENEPLLGTNSNGETIDSELDDYVTWIERIRGRSFPTGRGSAKCLRLNIDEVDMRHRPLAWYLIVSVVDHLTSAILLYQGFRFYRLSYDLSLLPSVFPLRPLHGISRHVSASSTLSYWLRPHKSLNQRPIVFLHGIGIGLWTYTSFFSSIDPDIGILAIELLPISFRLTRPFPARPEFLNNLRSIISSLGTYWEEFTLISHSYGSVLTTHILHDATLSARVQSIILIDPVSILLHLPDVAYNFTSREPRQANEWQLWYCASKDMMVAHTLHRGFFWKENIIWREELVHGGRRVTVVLGGQDIVAPTRSICDYLGGVTEEWTGKGLEVLWNKDLDHAKIFETKEELAQVVRVAERYCQS